MIPEDPFAPQPAADEAQQAPPAPVAPPAPPAAPAAPVAPPVAPTPAPVVSAPVTTTVTKDPATVVATTESGVSLTFKGGTGFDDPWIVVHAVNLTEALDHVTTHSPTLVALMQRVQGAAEAFRSSSVRPVAQAPAAPAAAPASAPPAGAVGAPSGEVRQCVHGQMQYKTGFSQKQNRTWQAFMCPTPKGTPGQCPAQWL